jgi:hypothetical protein
MPSHSQERSSEPDPVRLRRRWHRFWSRSCSAPRMKEERKRNAGRRVSFTSAPCGAARADNSARSAAGVPPRRLPKGRWSQRLSPGQASWDAVQMGVTHPRLSQSSGCTPRTGLSADQHDARNRPGAKVTNPRPREPLSLHHPGSPDDVLHGSEIDLTVSETGTNVNVKMTIYARHGRARPGHPCLVLAPC